MKTTTLSIIGVTLCLGLGIHALDASEPMLPTKGRLVMKSGEYEVMVDIDEMKYAIRSIKFNDVLYCPSAVTTVPACCPRKTSILADGIMRGVLNGLKA